MATLTTPRVTHLHPAAIIAAAVGGALVVNLGLWLLGLVAGGSFEMVDNGTVQSVAPGGVVLMTVVPLTVGLTVATLLAIRWRAALRAAQVVGTVLALVTILGTVTSNFDVASTITLSLMHVAIVPFLVTALEAVGKRWA